MQLIEQLLNNLDNIFLVLLGIAAFVSAVFILFLRNPMQVAVALILVMVSLSGIYGLLGVHFIAAFQILIYVGAIMVFMLYIIMLLNVRDSSFTKRYSKMKSYALILGIGLILLFIYFLGYSITIPDPINNPANTFTVSEYSKIFLSEYWFEFQLVAILLLFAIVAAISLLKTNSQDPSNNPDSSEDNKTKNG